MNELKTDGEKMSLLWDTVNQLLINVKTLEESFPGRRFTLDGHLIGSIGEVLANYYYGIKLYPNSAPIHDGETCDGKKVQIKITQGTSIDIREQPDYLIVFYFDRNKHAFYEVYNGSGKFAWRCVGKRHKNGEYSMSLSKLTKLNQSEEVKADSINLLHSIDDFSKK